MKQKWLWLCLALQVFAWSNSTFSQELWVLENFEQGVKQWFIQTKQTENEGLPLVHLTTTSLTPPEGGKQAGLFVWRRAGKGEWGRFVLPLDGAQLSAKKSQGLTFWWVGDGNQSTVSFVLVAERQGSGHSKLNSQHQPLGSKSIWDGKHSEMRMEHLRRFSSDT
jgi:hypothetical protein